MSFTERFMRFMHWPASRKVALLAAIMLPLHALAWWRMGELQARFDEPVTRALELITGYGLGAAIVLLALGVIGSLRHKALGWSAYLFAALYAVFVVETMHAAGLGEPMFIFWIPASALLLAVWFDERVGGAHLLMCMAVIIVDINLRDAALAAASAAEVARAVHVGAAMPAVLLLMADFLLCILVLSVHRLLRERLDAANRDLERSQRLIRRYVPGQLAERIAAGGHETTRHERRKLTLFFSDVVGFTDLSDELDAEELAAFLNEYLAEMTLIADRFGATVNQLVGDGIMIFFGAPTATDDRDHALRCVQMALAMQARMRELRDMWFKRGLQRPFQIRIGINTGYASVGDFGSQGRTMYSAIGQQTNLAARIQAQCEPGKVLISHATWALVHDAIPCKPKGQIEVKGLHYPVLVYEVTAVADKGMAA